MTDGILDFSKAFDTVLTDGIILDFSKAFDTVLTDGIILQYLQ